MRKRLSVALVTSSDVIGCLRLKIRCSCICNLHCSDLAHEMRLVHSDEIEKGEAVAVVQRGEIVGTA